MRNNKLKKIVAILLAASGLIAGTASASVINLFNNDFETGTLSSWSTIGSVSATGSTTVTTSNSVVWSISAAGTTMAHLVSNGAAVSTIESTLGISAGTLNALNTNPNGGTLTNGAALYQSFSGNAGDTVSFAWDYVATDYIPFNDPAFALLVGPSSSVTVLASINGLGLPVGTSGHSGWQSYTGTLGSSGTYSLAFVTTNDKDQILNSHLFIDNVAGSCDPACPNSVPEPGTLAIVGLGLAMLAVRRKDRQSS